MGYAEILGQQPDVTLTLVGERPLSWNQFFSRSHWSARQEYVTLCKQLVRGQIDPDEANILTGIVDIELVAFFKNRPQDSSNFITKAYIDGLIGWYLVDDGPEYVRNVITRSEVDKKEPRIEISLFHIP